MSLSTIYLAFGGNPVGVRALQWASELQPPPALLVSFFYYKDWIKVKDTLKNKRRMLDSGAYSAWNSGKAIDIEALIEETKKPIWDESVSLDVIGDAEASMKNALYMKSKGSPAFPVFHIGDPWEMLVEYCKEFDKVGLSCRFGEPMKTSMRWLDNCFSRVWPHKFHSFGWTGHTDRMLMLYPFHSSDSSTWITSPTAYGHYPSMGALSIRGNKTDVRSEIEHYRRMEIRVSARWKKELSRWAE